MEKVRRKGGDGRRKEDASEKRRIGELKGVEVTRIALARGLGLPIDRPDGSARIVQKKGLDHHAAGKTLETMRTDQEVAGGTT